MNAVAPGLRWLALLLALWLGAAWAQEAVVQPAAADARAMQQVIRAQLAALRQNDADAAFRYATPEVRESFRNPGAFMAMVREGYGALFHPRSERFLDAAIIGRLTVQPLELVSADGSVLVALYAMERQPDGSWRIAGCELAPSRRSAI